MAFLLSMLNPVFGQSDAQKESEIVNLIISFQNLRFSDKTKAETDIKKAISIAETTEKKNNLVSTKILLGELYDDYNNPNKALTQYTEAKKIANNINDIAGLASCEYNLGYLFYKQGSEEKKKLALTHFKSSIQYSKEIDDENLLAKSYNSASFIYYDLDEIEKAQENSMSALILFRKLKKRNRMAQSYLTLARVNNKKEKFNEALEYLDSAIGIYETANSKPDINNALLVKSEIYYQKKNYKKAIEIAKIVDESPSVMADQKLYALNLLYQINKSMNKTSASLDYLEETKGMQDSLFQLERNRMMESVESVVNQKDKLEVLEKEAEISELQLKQSKYWTWVLIALSIVFLLIALSSFLFYRQNKLKSEREKLKLEQESIQLEQTLLRTQMNPHFIANSLAAIQGNIYKQDKEKSVTYLSKFAKLMRFILESSREKEVLLEKEIISLRNYMDLQKLLLEEKLTYTIDVEKGFHTDEYKIPPMLIQPFVENAIVHGIELKNTPGNVTLNFTKEKELLKVTIKDDGLGREKVNEIYKKRNSSHMSFSTNITNERIEKINTEAKENITSVTQDVLENGEVVGTIVELIIPLKSVY
ncbi:histidine kinase [Flavobacteriales bacterium]|nr:histidine kinase [Flavobacteriales bacterium]